MSITTITNEPRVWIGCLSCYNDGRLVGEWVAAIDASHDKDMLNLIHKESGGVRAGCEEMQVLDTDNMPVAREMQLSEAAEWGQLLDEVYEWQRDALIAWVRSDDYITDGTGELPSLPDFEDAYAGEWDSFREYAESLADDIGLMANVDSDNLLARYFDWEAWTRDLAMEHTTEPAPNGGVYVFRQF